MQYLRITACRKREHQIRDAQTLLHDITGRRPTIISYPNGNYSNEIVQIARGAGLSLGITGITKKNYLPISFDGATEMTLGRLVPSGRTAVAAQCRAFRSDLSLYAAVRSVTAKAI